jgi:hypothetical protein
LKINAASEPRNFKLMHVVKLKFLSFNPHISIAASKPRILSSDAALKVKRILIFLLKSRPKLNF